MTDRVTGVEAAGLDGILDSLTSLKGIEGGVVATEDGLPLATQLSSRLDEEALAGAAAAVGHSASRILNDISWGQLGMAVLEGSRMKLLVCPLSAGYLLALAAPEADLEAIAPQVSSAARDLEEAFASLIDPATGV